jgi:UDP:flavonoid glycosyltransferase YjiC (YdhE family)
VTEALAAGVPLVVLPFSTDQFAVAADLERTGLGLALDPNRATSGDIGAAVRDVVSGPARAAATRLGAQLRADPGPERGRRALTTRFPVAA